ncbi:MULTISPECIES: LacI family DNA-binding transcriptional regulator [Flavobacteriaceae]|uniref:LacI family DNA-binding transcriptional regulator n=1 Tax=Flavobacteriaceae TaxID=49546 RepID=UPI0010AE81AE|nr:MULTISPECIES: LacI family DNA-binding transcriptional regulator [Flavobacteriaceae]NJB36734.1 LacI family transcriptional regulator [Croceivirga sp. JEA036]TKD63631.1 LacI family transcriptional regulator [Flavobacterium sp. ASW18X]
MKKKITLKHIAKELDVSISTVSKALKNSEEISRDTKEKIQAFAKLYNYRPNNIAVSLKNKRTKNIGVIIPDIVHHFFATVISGVEKYANSLGYNVIVCLSDESFDKEVINMEMLANGSIDGFIMSLSSETQQKGDYNHIKEVTEQGIPLVLFDRVTNSVQCDKVIIDDQLGAYKATKKLLDMGKRNIALLTTEDYLSVGSERTRGYLRAHADSNIAVNDKNIFKMPTMEMEEALIRDFIANITLDALLCVNEIFAVFGLKVVKELGMKVPEEVSVIGFTDGLLSKYSNPSLTSIAQHGESMGETAAKMLIKRIEDESEEEEYFQTKIIEPTLIEREST